MRVAIPLEGEKSKWIVRQGSDMVEVRIKPEVVDEMMAYADEATGEISGLGMVEREGNIFTVTQVRIFKQECTGADTEIDNEALGKFFHELTVAGGDPTKWRLWWHSHAHMAVFFSATDDDCIKTLLDCWQDYVLAIVVNKKEEMRSRVDFGGQVGCSVENPPTGLDIELVQEPGLKQRIKDEVREMVAPKKWTGNLNRHDHAGHGTGAGQTEFQGKGFRVLPPPRPGFQPEREPYISGEYDSFNFVWRHKNTGSVWDEVKGGWFRSEDAALMTCGDCRKISKRVKYLEAKHDWVCPMCYQDVVTLDSGVLTPEQEQERVIEEYYRNGGG